MLKFTPAVLRAAYAFLAETEPFVNWNLPDAEDVEFCVKRDRQHHGQFVVWEDDKLTIRVMETTVGSTHKLIETMAHEMIHVHLHQQKMDKGGEHGAIFMKLLRQVARVHVFDPKWF